METPAELVVGIVALGILCAAMLFMLRAVIQLARLVSDAIAGLFRPSKGRTAAAPGAASRKWHRLFRNPRARAFFVFTVLAALTAHAAFGWMGIFTVDGTVPRAIRPFDALNSGLDTAFGTGAAIMALLGLTLVSTLIVWRKGTPASVTAGPRTPAAPQPSEADRALVTDMLTGITAQIDHEARFVEACRSHPAHVRLALQVPLRDRTAPKSWFGGAPSLPPGVPWPRTAETKPYRFLAQLDCAALPAAHWAGAGPRSGWLILFLSDDGAAHVLHTESLGTVCPCPPDLGEPDWRGTVFSDLEAAAAAPVRWPVDLVEVPAGTDSRTWAYGYAEFATEQSLRKSLYTSAYSILEPRFAPFDWQSLIFLLRAARSWPERRLKFLEKGIGGIGHAKKGSQDRQDEAAALTTTVATLDDMETAARAKIGEMPFTQEDLERLAEQLQSLPAPRIGPDAESTSTLSMRSRAGGEDWHYRYVALLHAYCQRLHATDPGRVPPRIWQELEPVLAAIAQFECGISGAYPVGYVPAFDLDKDVVLLQLPTSGFLKWQWGDVYSLVLSIRKDRLAAGDFSEVTAQITN